MQSENTGQDLYARINELVRENERLKSESEEFRMLYETILKHATSLENDLEKKLREITYLSNMDTLTNVFNRRKFNECLLEEVEKAKKFQSTLSIIIYDIDNFKGINDKLGHGYGDFVLVTSTQLIKDSLRDTDIIARWGGDEFVILLPDAGLKEAEYIAENLRKKVEEYHKQRMPLVTCSFGVAQFTGEDNMRSLLKRADDALYSAKKSGRNSVRIASL